MGSPALIDLARIELRTRRCTQCAACRPGCPTFDVTGLEGHSGRGRVILARGLLTGALEPDVQTEAYLGSCTRCGWCETVCPVDIPVVGLVEAALSALGEVRERPAQAARACEREARALLDRGPAPSWPGDLPGPLALHRTCVTRWSDGAAGDPLERLLRTAGAPLLEVEQGACCGGAPAPQGGHEDLLAAVAAPYIERLRDAGVRTLVTADPHCARHLAAMAAGAGDLSVIEGAELLRLLSVTP